MPKAFFLTLFFFQLAFLLLHNVFQVSAGNSDHFQLKGTGYCLNSPARANYGTVDIWSCDGNDPDQDWVQEGDLIRLKNTSYCLNTPNRANYGDIFLWSCDSGDADQRWERISDDRIRLKGTNYCLNTPDRSNGGDIFLWSCDSGDSDQKWVRGTSTPSGPCPGGGLYCGGSVGQNSNNLYHCSGAGANPTLSQSCQNGCQTNPPGTADQCRAGACPGSGDYCGGNGVPGDSNTLYNCASAGANPTIKQQCAYGCQYNPSGTADVCKPAPGACPGGGLYCGGNGVPGDSNTLYHCTGAGANPTVSQQCSNGCSRQPTGTDDFCNAGGCPGSGWYCGGSVGQNSNNLYQCSGAGAIPTLSQTCSNGCQVNPPGTPDECKPAAGACPSVGNYCGGNGVPGDSNTLYNCSAAGANPTVVQQCSNGCSRQPSGTDDFCNAGACPGGGWYCGGSVGQNSNNLYYCSNAGAAPTLSQTCQNGCQVNASGVPDECKATSSGSCPTGGLYCGSSVGKGDSNLYYCSSAGANPQLREQCSNGCKVNPPGTPDQCNGGSCPGYGWYCGGSVGQNANYRYYCSSAGASPALDSACTNGCQVNPPGTPDQCKATTSGMNCPTGGYYCGSSVGGDANTLYYCTAANAQPQANQQCSSGCQINPQNTPDVCKPSSSGSSGFCENMPSSSWAGAGQYCNGDTLVQCNKNKVTVGQTSCGAGKCKKNPPGTADECTYDLPPSTPDPGGNTYSSEQLNSTKSHIHWPFSGSWGEKDGWTDTQKYEYRDTEGEYAGHFSSDAYSQDWANTGGNFATCNKDFKAPISGKVIYAGSRIYGNQVIIQSDKNPNFAVRVGHLNVINVVADPNKVIPVGTVVGRVGNTGLSTNCHAHIALYKNLDQTYQGKKGIDILKEGGSLGLEYPAEDTKFSADFEMDAAPATGSGMPPFVFPIRNWWDYKVEKNFGYGSGPINQWKNCTGIISQYNTGNKYHAGIDVIHRDAKGTEEVFNSTDAEKCRMGAWGTQVVAMGSGTVVAAYRVSAFDGDIVIIKHDLIDNGRPIFSVSLHIDKVVNEGDRVMPGTPIGYVGNYSHNPHLHFEIKTSQTWNGGYSPSHPNGHGYINPCDLIRKYGGAVPANCSNVFAFGGGMVESTMGSAKVEFQDGSTDQDLLVTLFQPSDEEPVVVDEDKEIASSRFRVIAQDSEDNLVTNFDDDVAVELTYSVDPDAVDINTLKLHYFDEATDKWIELPSTIDTENNTVTGFTDHFTEFAVIGEKRGGVLDQPDAVIAYRSNSGSGAANPKIKLWDEESGNFGSEIELPTAGSPIRWVELKTSPVSRKVVLVTYSDDGYLDAYVCMDNCGEVGSWTVTNQVGQSFHSANDKRHDIAFESATGDAVLVYAVRDTNGTRDLAYKVLPADNDSFAGIGQQFIDDTGHPGDLIYWWVNMDRNPKSDSQEIAMIGYDSNAKDINAWIWNGNAWGNRIELSSNSIATANRNALDVAYNSSGTKALIMGGTGTNGEFASAFWDGTQWSPISTRDVDTTDVNDIAWIDLKPSPTNEQIQALIIDYGKDLHTGLWSGGPWSVISNIDISVDLANLRPADFEWNHNGTEGKLVWDTDGDGNKLNYRNCNPKCNNPNQTAEPFGVAGRWLTLYPNYNSEQNTDMLGIRMNGNGSLGVFAVDDGAFNNFADNILSTNVGASAYEVYSLDFFNPPLAEVEHKSVIAYRSSVGAEPDRPKIKVWDAKNNVYGDEIKLPTAGSPIRWLEIKKSPFSEKLVLVTNSDDGYLDAYVCMASCEHESSWTVTNQIGQSIHTPNDRRFDIDFETSTGDAVVVYAVQDTNGARDLAYKILPSNIDSFAGIGQQFIDDTGHPGDLNYWWVNVDNNPKSDSQELALIGFDSNAKDINAWIWDGNAWGNQKELSNSATATLNKDALDIAYTYDGSKVIAVGGTGTNGELASMSWDGAAWSDISTVDIDGTDVNDIVWIDLKPSPTNQNMQTAIVDSGSDLHTALWSGTSWNLTANIDTAIDLNNLRAADFEWNKNGTSGKLVWDTDGNGDKLNYRNCNPSCTSTSQTATSFAAAGRWLTLYPGNGNADILGIRLNGNSGLGGFRIEGGGITNNGDTSLSSNVGASAFEAYSLVFWK